MDIGSKLKRLRKNNDLTLKDLAKKTGISVSFISDIENRRRTPSIEKLNILANSLGVSINDFFDSSEGQNIDFNNLNDDTKKEKNTSSIKPENKKYIDTIAAHLDDKDLTPKKVKLIQNYIDALFDDEE